MHQTLNASRLINGSDRCDQPKARARMICRLAARGIGSEVLRAMSAVPRHAFVPPELLSRAYEEDCHPVPGNAKVLTSPYGVAWMTQNLELDCRKQVLEVGTGSGYHTSILALLAGHVFTVERVGSLVEESAAAVKALGLSNVSLRQGDGNLGWPEAGPFDAILATAAATSVPPKLLGQLAQGGRLVIPIGPRGGRQRLYRFTRTGAGVQEVDIGPACFVPFVGACRRDAPVAVPQSCGS